MVREVIGQAVVEIIGDSSGLEEAIAGSTQSIQDMGKQMSEAGSAMTKFITLPLAAAATAATAAVIDIGNFADKLFDLEQITGISTTTLQEFRAVTAVAGTDQDALATAATRLNRQLTTMEDGTGKAAEAMAQLGVNIHDADGNLRPLDDLMPEVVGKLADMEDITRRNALSTDLFGGAHQALAPVLGLTSGEIEDITKRAGEMGRVLGVDALTEADDFRKQVVELREEFGAWLKQLQVDLIPVFRDTIIPLLQNSVLPAFRTVGEIIGNVVEWFNTLSPELQTFIIIMGGVVAAIGPLLLVIGKVIAVWPALVAAFALLTGPVGIFIAVTVGLAALVTAWSLWKDDIIAVVNTAIDWIRNTLSNLVGSVTQLWNDIIAPFQAAIDRIWQIWHGFSSWFSGLFGTARKDADTQAKGMNTEVNAQMQGMRTTLNNVWSTLPASFTTWFSTARANILHWTGQIRTALPLGVTVALVTDAWKGIPAFFRNIWQTARNHVSNFVGQIRSFFTSATGGTISVGGGGTITTSQQHGGLMRQEGLVEVGERGREVVNLPRGATVTPLPVGERMEQEDGQGAGAGRGVVLNQYITAQARPEDLQIFTERAIRKIAMQWDLVI